MLVEGVAHVKTRALELLGRRVRSSLPSGTDGDLPSPTDAAKLKKTFLPEMHCEV